MREKPSALLKHYMPLLAGGLVFLFVLVLNVWTMAPGLVFGDPAEYTFVPHIWGISHPPGYSFQTVLGGVWQRLVPIGAVAYRANLLSAVLGAGVATLVYASVMVLTIEHISGALRLIPGVTAGLSAAAATDIWQHSIHANAHITTAFLASLSIFLLLRWGADPTNRRWLYGFCVIAGLSVTQHPLLVFGFPAYTVYILVTDSSVLFQPTVRALLVNPKLLFDAKQIAIVLRRPHLAINFKTQGAMLGFALIGLSGWLYLPLRASLPAPILFGPENTNTLNGFLDLVLARGLTVNLFHFGLAEQVMRIRVFLSLLQLQASLPIMLLMLVGFVALVRRRHTAAWLFGLYLLVNLAFIMNTIQDVMAYLMLPIAALMILAGAGIAELMGLLGRIEVDTRWLTVLQVSAVLLILFPIARVIRLAPAVSLRDYTEAEDWVESVYDRFEGKGEGAYLLAHWEHLTPFWYAEWVEDRPFDKDDLTLVFVATTSEQPWVDNVWERIDDGPVYVSGYQRSLVDAGFRLRPEGTRMYRVLPAPAVELAQVDVSANADLGPIVLDGVTLPVSPVEPGQVIPMSIAMSISGEPTGEIYFPYAILGEWQMNFTTDNHYLTPYWLPDETHVERYDMRAPLWAEAGDYPVKVGIRNLTTGEDLVFPDGDIMVEVGTVSVIETVDPVETDDLIAGIAYQAGLVNASIFGGGKWQAAPSQEPVVVNAGDVVRVELRWRALNQPDENWKVFVQLTGGGGIVAQQDAPPMGGAFPTFLWFPKWVPGQEVTDIYRITVPPSTLPGDYQIEVGMYGFNTFQRAHYYDPAGYLSGDRFILGPVRVEE